MKPEESFVKLLTYLAGRFHIMACEFDEADEQASFIVTEYQGAVKKAQVPISIDAMKDETIYPYIADRLQRSLDEFPPRRR